MMMMMMVMMKREKERFTNSQQQWQQQQRKPDRNKSGRLEEIPSIAVLSRRNVERADDWSRQKKKEGENNMNKARKTGDNLHAQVIQDSGTLIWCGGLQSLLLTE